MLASLHTPASCPTKDCTCCYSTRTGAELTQTTAAAAVVALGTGCWWVAVPAGFVWAVAGAALLPSQQALQQQQLRTQGRDNTQEESEGFAMVFIRTYSTYFASRRRVGCGRCTAIVTIA
jgi:hypothetical protein